MQFVAEKFALKFGVLLITHTYQQIAAAKNLVAPLFIAFFIVWLYIVLANIYANLATPDKRQIVGYDIAFDKSLGRIQRLVDSFAKARQCYSDSYPVYAKVCYDGNHLSLKNKSQTYTVEGMNSDLRHYIPALHRRSKCFFISVETMKAVFKIFVNAFNRFAASKKFLSSSKKRFFLTNSP